MALVAGPTLLYEEKISNNSPSLHATNLAANLLTLVALPQLPVSNMPSNEPEVFLTPHLANNSTKTLQTSYTVSAIQTATSLLWATLIPPPLINVMTDSRNF